MVINTNISSLTSARLLSESSNNLSKSLARLSSGSKIVSPEDDAAGLAVSMKLDAQINRTGAAQTNLGNAISFSQTQDGFLQKVGKALDRMSELSVLAQDPTKQSTDLTDYKTEFDQLATYINDLATKQFNGVNLFSSTGTATKMTVTTDGDGKTVDFTGVDMKAFDMTAEDLSSASGAKTALTNVTAALDTLGQSRATVGANISVLNSYNDQLSVLSDNLSAANSRIKDVDVAKESATYAKYNILVQAGTAMLAQANQQPQSVLKLLG